MTIDGSAGVTFPDGTQQAKSQQGAAFSVYRNTAQTISTFATVAADVKEYDTANAVSAGVFTAPVAGYYQFNGYAGGATTPSTSQIRFSKNSGAAFYSGNYMTGTANAVSCSALIFLNAGDIIAGSTIIAMYDGTRFQLSSGAGGGGAKAGGVIYENTTALTSNYTLTTGSNGLTVGPMTISSGVTLTVPIGQRMVIL